MRSPTLQVSAPGIIIAHGNLGDHLTNNPDVYISRDGGVSWMQTLAGSWGITVADHGGLLVAVRDYHQSPSDSLKYSCDEGSSWTDFRYTATNMTVYGVLTEPGEETSIIRWFTIDTHLMLGIILHVSPSCLLYTSPSPRDATLSRMPSSA